MFKFSISENLQFLTGETSVVNFPRNNFHMGCVELLNVCLSFHDINDEPEILQLPKMA